MSHHKSKKSTSISRPYLSKQLDENIGALKAMAKPILRKNDRKKHEVFNAINNLRKEIESLLDDIPHEGIRDKQQLENFCKEVKASVLAFKRNREVNVKQVSNEADRLLKNVRKQIEEEFDLPDESPARPAPVSSKSTPKPKPAKIQEFLAEGQKKEVAQLAKKSPEVIWHLNQMRKGLLKEVEDFSKTITDKLLPKTVHNLVIVLVGSLETFLYENLEQTHSKLTENKKEIQALTEALPTADTLEKLHESIQDAYRDSVRQHRNSLNVYSEFIRLCKQVEEAQNQLKLLQKQLKQVPAFLEEMKKRCHGADAEILLGDKFADLNDFNNIADDSNNKLKACFDILETAVNEFVPFLAKKGNRKTLESLLKIHKTFPLAEGEDTLEQEEVKILEELFAEKISKGRIEFVLRREIPVCKLEKVPNSTEEKPVKQKRRKRQRFSWKKATPAKRKKKALSLLKKARPEIQELISDGRWSVLRDLLFKIKRSELQKQGFNQSVIGKDGVYKSMDEMYREVIPEAFALELP